MYLIEVWYHGKVVHTRDYKFENHVSNYIKANRIGNSFIATSNWDTITIWFEENL